MIAEWSDTDMHDAVYLLSVILIGWLVIRLIIAVRRRRVATENRHWSYCPRCGWPRPGEGMASANPSVRPERNGASHAGPVPSGEVPGAEQADAAACCQSQLPKQVLPSDLLKHGWSRLLAEDSEGDMIPPNDSRACAWSIYGAAFCAFPEGSVRLKAFLWHLQSILNERYGGPTFAAFNSDPRRNHYEIIGISLECQRRASVGSVSL